MSYVDYLLERYRQKHHKNCDKISELLNFEDDIYLFLVGDLALTESTNIDPYCYELCINPELREIITWTSNKIFSTLKVGSNYKNIRSVFVYIRIATSRLNKLVCKSVDSHEAGIYYHDNLIRNVNALISELRTDDLPF